MTTFWRDRVVFVTGGSGFVGGWLVERLVDAGADVVCLVRDWDPRARLVADKLVDKVRVVHGDVCDQALLERVLGEHEVDTVMHLAAQAIVPVANRNSPSTFDTNVRGTWALLEACRRSPLVKQILVASSDKVYGDQQVLPYTEDMALRALNPYDVSKSCADLIAQSYAATFALPVVVIRCGNFFGGGDLNWSRVVPGTIRSVLRGERPLIRSDGTLRRDYFYVEDGAAVYMHVAEALAARRELAGHAFNFSLDTPRSVIDVVSAILTAMGSPLEPVIANVAKHEIQDQWLSSEKARTLLGWKPAFSLEEGLRRSIEWYRRWLGAGDA